MSAFMGKSLLHIHVEKVVHFPQHGACSGPTRVVKKIKSFFKPLGL